MKRIPLVAILINAIPQSRIKKLPYEIVHGRKLKLPMYVVLQPLQSTRMPAIGDYVQEL